MKLKKEREKQKKPKKKRRNQMLLLWKVSVENLTWCDIDYKFALCVFNLVIEPWISPGCSYEFHVIYMQREKSQYLLNYNSIQSTHFQERK